MGSQCETGFLHVIAQKTGVGGGKGRRGRMNFTERAHVFSTPNVTFLNTAGGFSSPQITVKTQLWGSYSVRTENIRTFKWFFLKMTSFEIFTFKYWWFCYKFNVFQKTSSSFSVSTQRQKGQRKCSVRGEILLENTVQLKFKVLKSVHTWTT